MPDMGVGMAGWRRPGRAQRYGTLLGAGLLTAAVIGLVVVLPRLSSSPEPAPPPSALELDAVPVDVRVFVDEYGISMRIKTSFAEDLTLSSPTVQSGEDHEKATLWPLDGRDHEGEDLDPLILPKGTPVTIEGALRPACDGDTPDKPVDFAVRSRGKDGVEEVRRFTSKRPGILVRPTAKWCSMGPVIQPGGGSLSADGDAKADITVINPGPGTIVVTVPAFSQGRATWFAASATVPAGRTVMFVVKGSGVRYDRSPLPWEDGRLLVDGQPFTLPAPEDGWLG